MNFKDHMNESEESKALGVLKGMLKILEAEKSVAKDVIKKYKEAVKVIEKSVRNA